MLVLAIKTVLSLSLIVNLNNPTFVAPEEEGTPQEMQEIGIVEKAGSQIDIDKLWFKNEEGERVEFSEYFKSGKPVILSLIYFSCPNICSYLLNGMVNSLRTLKWTIGKEFEAITVSIHPGESSSIAKEKKANYIKSYGRMEAEKGWHFLTGQEDQVRQLADAVGFGYRYEEETEEYAHSAGVFVLTPDGKVSRTLYGIDYPNRDLRLSLMEASDGKIGTPFERFLMYCYKYDPGTRGYALYALRIVQAGGVLTILALGTFVFVLWRRERKQSKA